MLAGARAAAGGGAGLVAAGLAARARVAREELDDLLAHATEIGAELDEHLGRHAFALANETEKDVLGADVVVTELERLAKRQLEHLLGPRGEGDVAARRGPALADDLLDLVAHGLERDAEGLEGLGGNALALVDQPEQDVLGADVVVVEQPSFFLGQYDDPTSSVCEAFEHRRPPRGWQCEQCIEGDATPKGRAVRETPGPVQPCAGLRCSHRRIFAGFEGREVSDPERSRPILGEWPTTIRSVSCPRCSTISVVSRLH